MVAEHAGAAAVDEVVAAYRKVLPHTNNPTVRVRVDLGDDGGG